MPVRLTDSKTTLLLLRTATILGMDQQRGRSPSAGHQQSHISQSHSPSPQPFQENVNSVGLGLALDPSSNSNQQYMNGGFSSNHGLPSFIENNEFLNQQGQAFSHGGLAESSYISSQTQNYNPQFKQEDQSSPYIQQQQSFTEELLDANLPPNYNQGDFSLFSTPSGQGDQFDQSFFMNDISPQPGNSINPADLNISSPPNHISTPPNLLQPDTRSPSSAHQSPAFKQGNFQHSPSHSRNASLGPESAAFPQGQPPVEWGMMPPQFTSHRRTPSEYSDVSASSAAHSPNLGHHDFDSIEQHHSPMQHAQDSSLYQEVLGIGSFSLSDPQVHHSSGRQGLSPAHSPAISPRLGPQQIPNTNQQNSFMLNVNNNNNGFAPPHAMYGGRSQSPFQHTHNSSSVDMGQAQQMVPPEINVEFAPTSRQNSFDPPKPSFDQDALTPPERGM